MTELIIRSGKENMDVKAIHKFLTEDSYWAKGISLDWVDQSLHHSFCVGAFQNGVQVGFGRIITDYYTFGWFADFYVLPEHRGKGIAKRILTFIMEQPWSKRLRRMMLNTSSSHDLYSKFGFKPLVNPFYVMEVHHPEIYLNKQ
jgi:GNAT superfamily N-acetyltransferase